MCFGGLNGSKRTAVICESCVSVSEGLSEGKPKTKAASSFSLVDKSENLKKVDRKCKRNM